MNTALCDLDMLRLRKTFTYLLTYRPYRRPNVYWPLAETSNVLRVGDIPFYVAAQVYVSIKICKFMWCLYTVNLITVIAE